MLLHPKQKYKCRECGRQFVENPQNQISEEKKEMVDKLLLEKISLRGIGRSLGISFSWIMNYVKNKYREVPQQIEVKKSPTKLIIEVDELWSFVQNKHDKQWVWSGCCSTPDG